MLRPRLMPILGNRPLHKLNPTLLNSLYVDLMAAGYKKESPGGGLDVKTIWHIQSTLHKVPP